MDEPEYSSETSEIMNKMDSGEIQEPPATEVLMPVVLRRLVRQVVDTMRKHGRGNKRVLASTQYGMGFILTEDNEIVFREDSLTHDQRKAVAEKVNEITLPNDQVSNSHPDKTL